jgi:TonB family protein
MLLGMAAGGMRAQTVQDAEKAFEASVVGQKLLLKDYSEDAKREYRWTGAGVESDAPTARTLGLFVASSVKVGGTFVEIRGERSTLMKNDKGFVVTPGVPMSLRVDLNGASLESVLPVLRDQLFVTSLGVALAGVPPLYRDQLPYKLSDAKAGKKAVAPAPVVPRHGCSGKETLPKLIHQIDPEFPEDAHAGNYTASVTVLMTIDASGHVQDPWIAASVRNDFDFQALKAARQYVFQPDLCDGAPKAITVFVDVNFSRQ